MDPRDTDLTRLLQDAVSDVEPADRLGEIRRATDTTPRRLGWYTAGGVALAAAAAVTAFSVMSSPDDQRVDDLGPADPGPSTGQPDTSRLTPVPVYYVGDTSRGPRLYREFQLKRESGVEAAAQAMTLPAYDPDYRTFWMQDVITSVQVNDDVIDVTLAYSGLRDRPTGMTKDQAELAIQQLVYTVQGAHGARLPVQLRFGANPIDTVYGVPTSEPITNEPPLDVLSLVSISDPVEGLQVTDSFIAHGAASSFEGNVPWELQAPDGAVVRSGQATAGMETHLVEWETEPIDVSDLEPGRYTFVATTDDGAFTDTRTVVVL